MSKLIDAIRGAYFRKSKQVQLERTLERVEATLNDRCNHIEANQVTSDGIRVGIDRLRELLASAVFTKSACAPILNGHLVAKFVAILTNVHSNNEIIKGLETPDYIWRQLNSFNALAKIYGQLNSMEHKASIDGNGRPIPWYTYPAIEYLSNLDLAQKRVFEYGSGNSSLWWATRCQEIVAIESDREWYNKVSGVKPSIGGAFRGYRLCEDMESYVKHHDIINANIVIIDGTFRTNCAAFFLSKILEPNNFEILIYDNADWQPDVIRILNERLPEWVEVDFHGFGPINDFTSTTTIFLNSKVKQRYAKNISSMYAAPHGGGFVSDFKDNDCVREYLLGQNLETQASLAQPSPVVQDK